MNLLMALPFIVALAWFSSVLAEPPLGQASHAVNIFCSIYGKEDREFNSVIKHPICHMSLGNISVLSLPFSCASVSFSRNMGGSY